MGESFTKVVKLWLWQIVKCIVNGLFSLAKNWSKRVLLILISLVKYLEPCLLLCRSCSAQELVVDARELLRAALFQADEE